MEVYIQLMNPLITEFIFPQSHSPGIQFLVFQFMQCVTTHFNILKHKFVCLFLV